MSTQSLPTYYGTNNRLMTALQKIAEQDTAQYFYDLEHQPQFIPTNGFETFEALNESKAILRELAWSLSRLDGYVAEYGVNEGQSFKQLCTLNNGQNTFGFDAFMGLPNGGEWPGNIVHHGKFDHGGEAPFESPVNGTIVYGWFKDTLPSFDYKHEVAKFIHIDCDVYSATKDILDNSKGKIVTGTIIVFDDYCNHPNWRQGEYRAWQQYVSDNNIQYRYLYVAGMSVAIEIT